MAYILRARTNHTLVHNGRAYRDGDRIQIGKADAERIARRNGAYRFEAVDGDTVISAPPTSEANTPSEPKKS
jgi:hypothetical protein